MGLQAFASFDRLFSALLKSRSDGRSRSTEYLLAARPPVGLVT